MPARRKKLLVKNDYKLKHWRIPPWMNQELWSLLVVLKRQDSRWSENKIAVEAIRDWLDRLRHRPRGNKNETPPQL